MKTLKIWLMAATLIGLASCSSDDSQAPLEVRLNRITKEISANTTKRFFYNSDNQLIKTIELGDLNFGTTQAVENYSYDSSGKVSEVTVDYTGSSSFGFKHNYTYNSQGKVQSVTIKRYLGSGTYTNFSQLFFVYNTNAVERQEFRADGTTTRTVYEIANGNTTSYAVYTGVSANTPNGQLSFTNVYANYDDKKLPYSGLPLLFREPYFNTNNPGQSQSSSSTVNYTYEYNSDGYPTKITRSFNNTTDVVNYEYERI